MLQLRGEKVRWYGSRRVLGRLTLMEKAFDDISDRMKRLLTFFRQEAASSPNQVELKSRGSWSFTHGPTEREFRIYKCDENQLWFAVLPPADNLVSGSSVDELVQGERMTIQPEVSTPSQSTFDATLDFAMYRESASK